MIKYNEFWAWLLKLIFIFLPPFDKGSRIRGLLFGFFMRKRPRSFLVPWRCHIFNPNGLSVGHNSYLGYNSYFGQGKITIGKNVLIGPFVSITASNHVRLNGHFRNRSFDEAEVIIEDNVWIGAHACILSGVTIGKGAVVAAGSIVTKNVEAGSTVAGVPAVKI